MSENTRPAVIIIGRNEGQRLIDCLSSVGGKVSSIVYVDSGSTDSSVKNARLAGAEVVALDMTDPFTAARARNAGFAHLQTMGCKPDFIQFLDGDCLLDAKWLDQASEFLSKQTSVAVAVGRLRERFPSATIYNQLADAEWYTPVGQIKACGGIALVRTTAFEGVGGFNSNLIAGEEPELCVRLRQVGWKIWRIDAEMAQHDIAMTTFSQWWKRTCRSGFAYAQGAVMHGKPPVFHRVVEVRRAVLWGLLLPIFTILLSLLSPWGLLLTAIWPLQILRLRMQGKSGLQSTFLTIGKIPEGWGVLSYYWGRMTGKHQKIIEYK